MRSLSIVASGISHEVNNPLTIINLHLARLKSQWETDQSPENAILIQSIHKMNSAITRIANIISGLQVYASEFKEEEFEEIFLADVIENVLILFNKKLNEANIEIRKNEVYDQIIFGQPNQLKQVFSILIENSIDEITKLDDRWIEVSAKIENNIVRISITDSGKGLPRDVVENLFVPFFTTKEVNKGTGLGLAICHGIIKKMQGTLEYQLQNGHTSFLINIPLNYSS